MSAIDKFDERAEAVKSLLCVGLDSDMEKLPERFQKYEQPQFNFNRWIIEQTHEHTASYKFNMAFYEARGPEGLKELQLTLDYLQQRHPDIFTICDAKRGDIDNTNRGYVEEIFDWLGFDAVTLHPYLGQEALQPFLSRADKGCIVLCRTSNPGAGEFQDLMAGGLPLWQIVAKRVHEAWNTNHNCMLVVGATYPEEIKKVREITGDMTLLVPGIGAQGGSVAEVMQTGLNSQRSGLIIHSARGIIFAENPAEEAKRLKEDINGYR
ncbi:MAG: orotidine-5'-phosphate decarboxylase [Patescibacteria group bacterium]